MKKSRKGATIRLVLNGVVLLFFMLAFSSLYGYPVSNKLDGENLHASQGQTNYQMITDDSYTWQEMRFGATSLSLSDDGSINVALPFTFEFYDANFTSVNVGANGYISFIDDALLTSGLIPATGAGYRYIVAPFWGNLQPASGGGSGTIAVKSSGYYWTVAWTDIIYFSSGPTVGTFQITLYQNGDIVFNYDYINSTTSGYVCGLNHGINSSLYNAYTGLSPSTDNYTIRFTRLPNNFSPALTNCAVNPITGNQSTPFNFTVRYTDLDNQLPFFVGVIINYWPYGLEKVNPADSNYTDGCSYSSIVYLQPGDNWYYFVCSDGSRYNRTAGETLAVSSSNAAAPSLYGGKVVPTTGTNGTTVFTFSVLYSDPDNNAPTFVSVQVNGTTYPLARQDYYDGNFMDGCLYQNSTTLAMSGTYEYSFSASDGLNPASTPTFSNLTVTEPQLMFFDGMNYSWAGYFNWGPTSYNCTEVFTGQGGGIFNVTNTMGWSRAVNGNTRVYVWVGSVALYWEGDHEWVSIPTNISMGSVVPIAVIAPSEPGDQQFTVVGQSSLVRMGRTFDCWYLQSSVGSYAYFDKFSGLCISARLQLSGLPSNYWYTINITNTNVPLKPNLYTPTLTMLGLNPVSGPQSILFNFSVRYTDQDNDGPAYVNVRINGTAYPMTRVDDSDSNFTNGCTYQLITPLQPGTYVHSFECSDGFHPVAMSDLPGPSVTPVNTQAPVLSGGTVIPARGFNGTTNFAFTVTYSDADNSVPTSINVTVNGTTHAMAPADPLDINYINGRVYVYQMTLGIGTYVYSFDCSDGAQTGSLGPFNGPIVAAPPYFNGMITDYSFASVLFGTGRWNMESNLVSGLTYNTTCITNMSYFGNESWVTNFDTRRISSSTGIFFSGSYNPFWIFTNVSIGTNVLVGMVTLGSAQYTVTGDTIYNLPGVGLVQAWMLEDEKSGTIALYEKSTGLLLNGTFSFVATYTYTFRILNTNVPMALIKAYLSNGDASPPRGSTSITYNFSVVYTNLDNVGPATISVIIDSVEYAMAKVVPSDMDYTDGVVYQYLTSMTAGSHTCHFSATAGGKDLRFPTSGVIGEPLVLPYEFSALYENMVSPNCSDELDSYEYSIIYQDTTGNSPSYVRVYIDGAAHDMVKDPTDNDFTDGVAYTYVYSSLVPGIHLYYIQASNSSQVIRLPLADSFSGPEVVRRNLGSGYTATPPAINGAFNAAEWAGAYVYSAPFPLGSYMTPGPVIRTVNLTIYILNDETTVYFCIMIEGETYNNASYGDLLLVMCDNALNGVLDMYDQVVYIGTDPSFMFYSNHDCYFTAPPTGIANDTNDGGTEDVVSAFTHSNPVNGATGTYTFEFSMPYASADIHDLQLARGSQFGIKFAFLDYAQLALGQVPDFHQAMEYIDATSYGILSLATPEYHPTSNHPADAVVVQNSTGNDITWQLYTRYAIGNYRVLRNGVVIYGWTPWPGNATSIVVPVNTTIGCGTWNYTIQFNDIIAAGIDDSVLVQVNDIPTISGGNAINGTMIPRNATSFTIDWIIHDDIGRTGDYRVLLNGTLYIAWTIWNDGTDLAVPIDTNRGFAMFNYTIEYRDIYNEYGTRNQVFFTIYDSPVSTQPLDFTVLQNATSPVISWNLTDSVAGGFYQVLENGNPVAGWEPWTNGLPVTATVSTNLGFGIRNYTIHFNNSLGLEGLPDTVLVRVNDVPVVAIAPVALRFMQNATGLVISWTLRDRFGSGVYSVMVNGGPYLAGIPWANNTAFNVLVDTSRGLGTFTYELTYTDFYNVPGTASSVIITIDDYPIVVQAPSSAITVHRNDAGVTLSWTLWDQIGGGDTYSIYRDGSLVVTGRPWASNAIITYGLDTSLPAGRYEYTLVYTDANGNAGIDSVVAVTIEEEKLDIVKLLKDNLVWVLVSTVGIVVVVVGATVAASRRKKAQKAKLSGKKQKEAPYKKRAPAYEEPEATGDSASRIPPGQSASIGQWDVREGLNVPFGAPVGAAQAVSAPSAAAEVEAPVLPHDELMKCPGCNKRYTVDTKGVIQAYSCPTCKQVLERVVQCPNCKQDLFLPHDFYVANKNKDVLCPLCNGAFKL